MRRILALLVAGLLASSLAAPAPGMAKSGSAVRVVPPGNLPDDTAAIQAALDWCVAQGPGCTVQLQAGTYHTSQLVTYDFRGTFKGAGEGQTTIEALPNLQIDPGAPTGECLPDVTTCRWMTLVMFVDGTIEVSDLTIDIPATGGTASTEGFLFDALRFMGENRTDVSVDRIAVRGRHDDLGILGFNLVNGVIYTGELPRSSTPADFFLLSGSYSVRNSSFMTMFDGVSQDGFVTSSRVTIGGSPAAGNSFEDVAAGIDLESAQSSVFEVSYNTSSAVWDGMWVVPWQPDTFIPSSPSQYFIHDNTFRTSPEAIEWAQGLLLIDDPADPWIQAKIWHNTITLEAPLGEGIDATYTIGSEIKGNTITGSGEYAGIGLWGGAHSSVIANDVSGVAPDPTVGFAQIYLTTSGSGGPPATDDHVVCAGPGVTVLDQGVGTKVTGCGRSSSKGAGHPARAPGSPKAKPAHP